MTDAFALTVSLGGRWFGQYGASPCPVCQPDRKPKQNALTLAHGYDGRLLLHCKKSACAFSDILMAAGILPGSHTLPDPATLAQRRCHEQEQAAKRARQARAIWAEAKPAAGTIVETYLRSRCITCDLPHSLRYNPSCWHASAKRSPAMLGLIEGGNSFAVHRTFLNPNGLGKSQLEPSRMMLGAVSGGSVRLTEGPGPLVVAEGIETALSLASGLLQHPATIWAALSTSGLRMLRLPSSPGHLIIATDGDAAGRSAGQELAERAHANGWAVSLLSAPDGSDWNDILMMKGEAP